MAKTTLIILQIILLANALLAQSCGSCSTVNGNSCQRCSSCEARRLSPVPCYKTNDLVIVLDGSGSIGSANFVKAKSFVDKLAAAYNIQSSSRVGFITFSNTTSTVTPMTNSLSPAEMSSTILNAPYAASITNTHLGIDAAKDEFNSFRPVPRNMVVLTDGVSTNPSATSSSAAAALATGIRMFSVGIGSGVDQLELEGIAKHPNRVYNANNFDDLVELLNPLSHALCAP